MATDWHVPFFSDNRERGCQGWEVILHSVNTSEREGKKAKTSSPCTGVLQGDNYFLLPSSVTLPAAPSLETLHGTHRSKTKHERRGSESVRQKKRILCVKKTKKTKKGNTCSFVNRVRGVLGRWKRPWGTHVCVHTKHDVCGCLVKWCDVHDAVFNHLGMAGTRLPFSSMKCPPALSTQRWWRDVRACLAVVGVSFPSWLSAFFSGENSSSRSTSYTTNVLMDTEGSTSEHTKGKDTQPCFKSEMISQYTENYSNFDGQFIIQAFSSYTYSNLRICFTYLNENIN